MHNTSTKLSRMFVQQFPDKSCMRSSFAAWRRVVLSIFFLQRLCWLLRKIRSISSEAIRKVETLSQIVTAQSQPSICCKALE